MFTKILVPLDGSDKSFEALDMACNVAKKYDAEVFLLSVFRKYSFMEGSFVSFNSSVDKDNFEDALRDASKEIVSEGKEILKNNDVTKVRAFVRMGAAAKEILKFAKENNIDLIIIGSKGQGELSGYLLGGVSHKVTGLAKCPVMVV
ncbi:universal stress protein UspA [Arcobacter sp. CECT 8983]|uniref:universal stress protein n=1 Tax=Arcobacter sp. CECT 8983 TaxID=2044508 RepID=UPI00100B4A3F|nr:universal stress protein [Arcobacter sp. CECT 8983]RXJ90848.1 universal stress protein UspA [Arcobacter sp. CECT 8983]